MKQATAAKLVVPFSIGTIMACNIGANHHLPWLGLVVLLAQMAFFLPFTLMKQKRLLLTFLTGVAGFAVDSTLIASGVYIPTDHTRWLIPAPFCPEWIVALWLNYGFMVYVSWEKLLKKFLIAALFGFTFSLMIIGNAYHRDLVALSGSHLVSYLIVGVAWSVITISAVRIAPHLFRRNDATQ